MSLIAAPAREWQKYSTILGVALTIIGSVEVFARALQGSGVIPDKYLLPLLALLGALSVAAKFIQQQIPATPEQKVELAQAAADLPVKKGEDPGITVTVNNPPKEVKP